MVHNGVVGKSETTVLIGWGNAPWDSPVCRGVQELASDTADSNRKIAYCRDTIGYRSASCAKYVRKERAAQG